MLSWSLLIQLLWNYKLNLTTDPKFESVAVEVCKSTISEVSPSPHTHPSIRPQRNMELAIQTNAHFRSFNINIWFMGFINCWGGRFTSTIIPDWTHRKMLDLCQSWLS